MSAVIWTPERLAHARALRNAGLTYKAIAAELGSSAPAVQRVLTGGASLRGSRDAALSDEDLWRSDEWHAARTRRACDAHLADLKAAYARP